jgi:hypothetical protein
MRYDGKFRQNYGKVQQYWKGDSATGFMYYGVSVMQVGTHKRAIGTLHYNDKYLARAIAPRCGMYSICVRNIA